MMAGTSMALSLHLTVKMALDIPMLIEVEVPRVLEIPQRLIKRAFDIIFSFLGTCLVWPLMLLIESVGKPMNQQLGTS
jgi:lipopolysaccharide/colanic/teichoic acid biosynthesis glycosyltransferase